jgi:CheY-like chemotaxis protein
VPIILLAEDNKLNREMLARRLERQGFHVIAAVHGREAVEKAQAAAPDLILMDLSMPVLDGWQATRQLKAALATCTIPIIALTAHAMAGDREKALEAGCDAYHVKPVDFSRLVSTIRALLNRHQPITRHQPSTQEQEFSLLVVDDNEANREMLSRRLRLPGYRVSKARTGSEALEVIRQEPVDLVLLDLVMPEMSGLEVLRILRQTYSIIDLPVIMVTTKEQTEEVVAALELGANDYVTKPLNHPVVLARIRTQLALKKAHLAAGAARSPQPALPVMACAAGPESQPMPRRCQLAETEATADPRLAPEAWRVARAAVPAGQAAPAGALPRAAAAPGGAVARDADGSLTPPSALGFPLRSTKWEEGPSPDPHQGTWVQGLTTLDRPVLAGYEILEELGQGGMGVVYKARHERMNRVVALKLIDKHHLADPDSIHLFYREIEAAAQLSHPNIVLAYDAGQYNETHYFAMEYIEGIDLDSLLEQHGPLPVEEACHCIRQAALGLQHAFERGLVHRDIKPSNLLASWPPGTSAASAARGRVPEGLQAPLTKATIKILDLGLALLHRPTDVSEAAAALTRENRVVGTADYMAPEQWMNAHKVDIRADLYSLGCTFYHLLTGQVPFPSQEPMEKMLKHHLDEPVPLEQLRPGITPKVVAIVRKLMTKKPELRYQQPAELADALD